MRHTTKGRRAMALGMLGVAILLGAEWGVLGQENLVRNGGFEDEVTDWDIG